MPYQLEVTPTEYNSAVPPRGTQSLVFKVYQDVGGTKPQTFYKAFNWDQTLRWPIVLDTGGREKTQPLFQPGTNPWPIIFPLVEAELEKQMGSKPAIAPEVGLNPATYENFAIQNDNLVFFFGQGALLPESAGALAVSIPIPTGVRSTWSWPTWTGGNCWTWAWCGARTARCGWPRIRRGRWRLSRCGGAWRRCCAGWWDCCAGSAGCRGGARIGVRASSCGSSALASARQRAA